MLNTNPVVVRRTMAGFEDKGYVTSVERATALGWSRRSLYPKITLFDIHDALGDSSAVFTHRTVDETHVLPH